MRSSGWANAIDNRIVATAICDSPLRKHERLPDICAKYSRRPFSPTQQGGKRCPDSSTARRGPRRAPSGHATPEHVLIGSTP